MKVKLPFEPSTLGKVAACAAIDDNEHLKMSIEINNKEKIKLINFFKDINYKYINSATNFITIEKKSELEVKGILSKDVKKWNHFKKLIKFWII